MTEFLSTFILSQRVKELECATTREAAELSELATLMARVEKRSQWLQKRIRNQRRKSALAEHGLALARCYLAAAHIREYVSGWAIRHRADPGAPASVAELERNVASLVGQTAAIIEQCLRTGGDGGRELHASPLSDSGSEQADEDILGEDEAAER